MDGERIQETVLKFGAGSARLVSRLKDDAKKAMTKHLCVPAVRGSEEVLLQEIAARLKAGLSPVLTYLFGSRAAKTGTPESDYDIMTLLPESSMPPYQRVRNAQHMLRGLNASFDIVVLTFDEWRQQLASGVSLANEVSSRGILLHDARA